MITEISEYIVGAYLTLLKGCTVVDYNVHYSSGRLVGLDEIDVVGMDFKNKIAYLCEVTTHLDGVLSGSGNKETANRIRTKYMKMQEYADYHLSDFFIVRHFMFWSPVVRPGFEEELEKINGLELIINDSYAEYMSQLQDFAQKATYDTNNPAFRMLQILGHLRRDEK